MHLNFKNRQLTYCSFYNVLVATFFVTVLTLQKCYSYVPMALGIIATLSFLFYRFKLKTKSGYLIKRINFYFLRLLAIFNVCNVCYF